MTIDYRLPALRRRRSHIAVTVSNQNEILDAAQLDDKSANAYTYRIQSAQAEFDELEFVIEFFENYRPEQKAPRIPITYIVIAIAVAAWFALNVLTYLALMR